MGWQERFSLKGKAALVTGAGGGIGEAICEVLADAGADIVALHRGGPGLPALQAKVEGHGRRFLAIGAELASED